MYHPGNLIRKLFEPYYLFFDNLAWPGSDYSDEKRVLGLFQDLLNLFVVPCLILSFLILKRKENLDVFIRLWIFPASLFVSTIIYYGDIRYRVPYDGIFILIAFWVVRKIFNEKLYAQPIVP